MALLLLIRHGENSLVGKRLAGRKPGVHLNEHGRQQAEAAARVLAKASLKAIYSSPLERAMETAAPLAESLGLAVEVRPGLIEIDYGDWQGRTLKQLHHFKLWKVVQEQPSAMRFPGGETLVEAQQRIVQELESIVAGLEEKDVAACFSHGDPLRLAVAHFLGLPLDRFQHLGMDTAALTVAFFGKHGAYFGPIDLPLGLGPDLAGLFPEKKKEDN